MNDEQLINKALNTLKSDEVVIKMFQENDLDIDEIFYIPICFVDDLDVSARTEHGIIYLNSKLKENFEENIHYLPHEITHFIQQTTGTKPTMGSTDDDYLDNKYEQEGFQNQTKYIANNHGDEKAEEYIEKVLEHHDVPEDEKDERKKDLLATAQQLKLFVKENPVIEKDDLADAIKDFSDNFEEKTKNPKIRTIEKLPEFDRKYRLKMLEQVLKAIKESK